MLISICISGSNGTNKDNSNPFLFNDTTRIRMISRPSVKEAFKNSGLGRRGISQSFKDKAGGAPMRPRDPPPPPPPNESGTPTPTSTSSRLSRSASNGKAIYDIAEETGSEVVAVNILHTNNGKKTPTKPPRSKRSQSFTPASHSAMSGAITQPRAKSYEDKDDKDHIYEEIPSKKSSVSSVTSRPLPPIPTPTSTPAPPTGSTPKTSTTSIRESGATVVNVNSKLASLTSEIAEEDVKSIFVGATK